MKEKEMLQAMAAILDEKLKPINEEMKLFRGEMDSFRSEMESFRGETKSIKGEMKSMKDEMKSIKKEIVSINNRLGVLEIKAEKANHKIDNLDFNMKGMGREVRKDIRMLKDGQDTLITVLETKGILPGVYGH